MNIVTILSQPIDIMGPAMRLKSLIPVFALMTNLFLANYSFCEFNAANMRNNEGFKPILNSFGMKFVYIEPGNLLIKNIAVDSEHREVRIKDINKTGTTILLVEQNANIALSIANRAYVLETGRIKFSGDAKKLASDEEVRKAYLGG